MRSDSKDHNFISSRPSIISQPANNRSQSCKGIDRGIKRGSAETGEGSRATKCVTTEYNAFQTIPLTSLSPTSLSLPGQPNCDIRPTCHHVLRHSVASMISFLRPFRLIMIRPPAELKVLSHSTAI